MAENQNASLNFGFLTDEEVVSRGLDLARKFYKAHGYDAPEGFRFDESEHPQEKSMWNLACIAFEELTGTDLNEAVMNLED